MRNDFQAIRFKIKVKNENICSGKFYELIKSSSPSSQKLGEMMTDNGLSINGKLRIMNASIVSQYGNRYRIAAKLNDKLPIYYQVFDHYLLINKK